MCFQPKVATAKKRKSPEPVPEVSNTGGAKHLELIAQMQAANKKWVEEVDALKKELKLKDDAALAQSRQLQIQEVRPFFVCA